MKSITMARWYQMVNCRWCLTLFGQRTDTQCFCSRKCKRDYEHAQHLWVAAHEAKGCVGVKAYKRAVASAGGQETG